MAPLDWGLGHSTRCIPIISHLLLLGCKVILASEGSQATLLQHEFPDLTMLPLQGYRIAYTNQKRLFAPKILWQLPKIANSIQKERNWLNDAVSEYQIDLVISDNRFGLYHPSIPTVFITHQLHIKSPVIWAEKLIQKLNYKYIDNFTACWVPDEPGAVNIAGTLSHPKELPALPVTYLGGISRFLNKENVEIKYKLLVVISGPEPQRTLLEEKILKDLKDYHEPVLLVRGLPGSKEVVHNFNQVTIENHLPAYEMEKAFTQSEWIISRSGYTTVMDLLKLRKRSILIPTPGQTEQEYLARHLHKQKWCLHIDQEKFELEAAIEKAKKFPYQLPHLQMEGYKNVIEDFLEKM